MDDGDSNAKEGRYIDKTSAWKTSIKGDEICNMPLAVLENPFSRYSLLFSPPEIFMKWLQDNGFLISNVSCNRCGEMCVLTKRTRRIDGHTWRCKNKHETSVRRNSFFEKSHLYIQDVMNFSIEYCIGSSLNYCSKASGMAYRSSTVDWGNFCRDLFVEYYTTDIATSKFNGEIEIDESLFGRRNKHHR